MGESHFGEGQMVEVTSIPPEGGDGFWENAWFLATIIDLACKAKGTKGEFFLVEYEGIRIEDKQGSKPLIEYVHASHTRPLPPFDETISKFELNEHIDVFHNGGWREGLITRVCEDSKYGVCLRSSGEELESLKSDLRVHLEWVDGRWIFPEEQQQRQFNKELSFTSPNLGGIMDSEQVSRACNTAPSTDIAVQLASPRSADYNTKDVQLPDYATKSSDKMVENCILNTDAGLSLPSRNRKRRKATKAHLSELACLVRTMCTATSADSDAPQIMKTQMECGDKQLRYQFPRRVKVTMGGIKTTSQQTVVWKPTEFQKKRGEIRKDKVKEDNQRKGSIYKTYSRVKGGGVKVFSTGVSRNIEDEVQSPAMMDKKGVSLAASLDNRCGNAIEEQHHTNMIAVANQNRDPREEQNEIILRSVDNNCIKVREEINRMDLLSVDNQSKEAREDHNEPVLQSPLIDLTGDANVCIEKESLPFQKCSFMWESIESMEAFQKMPQKPHFRPLEQYTLSHREGMAIGHMVTFATLVAKMKDSQLPRRELEDMLDAFVDLKSHGFDVEKVQACVQESLGLKSKEFEMKITELSSENDKISIKIAENKKCIRELKEIMIEVKETLKSLKKKKETNVSDISALQRELDAMKDDLRTVECEYPVVAAGPC